MWVCSVAFSIDTGYNYRRKQCTTVRCSATLDNKLEPVPDTLLSAAGFRLMPDLSRQWKSSAYRHAPMAAQGRLPLTEITNLGWEAA